MQVPLSKIAHNTEFIFKGQKFRKGIIGWQAEAAMNRNFTVLGHQSVLDRVTECHPFYGGQFQQQLAVYICDDAQITIE